MSITNQHTLKPAATGLLFLLLSCCCPAVWAQSQQVKTFNGSFVNEQQEEGQATFGYYEDKEGHLVKEGPFAFEAKYTDSSATTLFIKKKYRGKYDKNSKTGPWTYQSDAYQVRIEDVDALKARTRVSGNQTRLKAHYKKGRPDGKWSFEISNFSESGSEQTIAQGSAIFREGRLSGPFYFEDARLEARHSIKGQFTPQGYMDSTWVFHYYTDSTQVRETRTYQQGFLLKLIQTDLSSGKLLGEVVYSRVKEQLQQLQQEPKNKAYSISEAAFPMLFDNGYAAASPEIRAQQNGNQHLQKAFEALFSSSNDQESQLGGKTTPMLMTARFHYPIRPEEKKSIEAAASLYAQLSTAYQALPMARLELNKGQDDSLAMMDAQLRHYQQHITSIGHILDKLQKEDAAYIDRSRWLQEHPVLQPEALPAASPDSPGDAPRYSVTEAEGPAAGVHYLEEHLRSLRNSFRQLSSRLDKRLLTVEQNRQLQALEGIVYQKIAVADSLYTEGSAAAEIRNSLHSSVGQQLLQNQLPRLMQQYAGAATFAEKQELSERMVQLLNTAAAEFPRIARIPAVQEELDQRYSRRELDPHTFNENFKVRIKRRLYEPVAETAIPFLLNRIRTTEDYRLLEGRIDNLFALHDQVLSLREEDTRRLERRLKRQQNEPVKIMRQLGIKLAD